MLLLKQVRSNKDASEGRDKDRIAERYLPDLIRDCWLQNFCRLFAGFLKVIFSRGSMSHLFQYFYAVFTQFSQFKKIKQIRDFTRIELHFTKLLTLKSIFKEKRLIPHTSMLAATSTSKLEAEKLRDRFAGISPLEIPGRD